MRNNQWEEAMSTVTCALAGCGRIRRVDGTGSVPKKTVRDEAGNRTTIYFCSNEHLLQDARPDLNEVPVGLTG